MYKRKIVKRVMDKLGASFSQTMKVWDMTHNILTKLMKKLDYHTFAFRVGNHFFHPKDETFDSHKKYLTLFVLPDETAYLTTTSHNERKREVAQSNLEDPEKEPPKGATKVPLSKAISEALNKLSALEAKKPKRKLH